MKNTPRLKKSLSSLGLKSSVSEKYMQYNDNFLRKGFTFFFIFSITNVIYLIISSFLCQKSEDFMQKDVWRFVFMLIFLLMLLTFAIIQRKIFKSTCSKLIIRVYFLIINLLNTAIFLEISPDTHDFSLPKDFHYFWMGYRLCAISIFTKLFSKCLFVSIFSLFIELLVINLKFNIISIEETYKPIILSIISFLMYSFFFVINEKRIYDDMESKIYQQEDKKLFKKLLDCLPEALLIINRENKVFYSNFNAKYFINNYSKNLRGNLKNDCFIEDFFKSFHLCYREKQDIHGTSSRSLHDINENEVKMRELQQPALIFHENNRNLLDDDHYNSKPIETCLKEAKIKTMFDLFSYFKANLSKRADPLIYSLFRTYNDSFSLDRYKKDNYFTLEFYTDLLEDQLKESLLQKLQRFPNKIGSRVYFSVQMSIIDVHDEQYFMFILDDVSTAKKAKEIQQEAIVYKDLLIASVSHELRTPLNGILNMIAQAIEESPEKINNEFLCPALNSSKLLLSIINDFLDFSMLAANKLRLNFSKFNIKTACLDCIHIVESQAKMKKLTMNFLIKPDTPLQIISEPNRLKQILLNLLNNSIKFTQKGSISLEVSAKNRQIFFIIRDTGVGITGEERNRLEKLISDENFLSKINKNSTGAGLGLKISAKLIRILNESPEEKRCFRGNSSIVFHSEIGKGSQFQFSIYNHSEKKLNSNEKTENFSVLFDSFPQNSINYRVSKEIHSENFEYLEELSEFQEKTPENQGNFEETSLKKLDLEFELAQMNGNSNKSIRDFEKTPKKKQEIYAFSANPSAKPALFLEKPAKKALIVDDDGYNQKVMAVLLSPCGFSLEFANNGQEALEKLEKIRDFSVIFMDFNMPLVDGLEATEKIVEKIKNKEICEVPVVGVTAYSDEREILKGFHAGMKEVLQKPVQKESLVKVLQRFSLNCAFEISYQVKFII